MVCFIAVRLRFISANPFVRLSVKCFKHSHAAMSPALIVNTSKEPVCPRVELILKIIIILLIIFLGFSKNKPC